MEGMTGPFSILGNREGEKPVPSESRLILNPMDYRRSLSLSPIFFDKSILSIMGNLIEFIICKLFYLYATFISKSRGITPPKLPPL
jgi:hypothetical protein